LPGQRLRLLIYLREALRCFRKDYLRVHTFPNIAFTCY
jgi:hypothetical protein